MLSLPTHICVTQHQRVKSLYLGRCWGNVMTVFSKSFRRLIPWIPTMKSVFVLLVHKCVERFRHFFYHSRYFYHGSCCLFNSTLTVTVVIKQHIYGEYNQDPFQYTNANMIISSSSLEIPSTMIKSSHGHVILIIGIPMPGKINFSFKGVLGFNELIFFFCHCNEEALKACN